MAKKKSKSTKQLDKLKKDRRAQAVGLVAIGILIGLLIAWFQPVNLHPRNLVWGADKSVTVPSDLAEFLRRQDECQSYRGSNNPRGVGLWGVYQVSQEKFAKIAYGCGFGLTRYIMAVKENNDWQLLNTDEYFANNGDNFLPNCSFVDRYGIDRSIEPFCIEPDGQPRENTTE